LKQATHDAIDFTLQGYVSAPKIASDFAALTPHLRVISLVLFPAGFGRWKLLKDMKALDNG
jgi:hypothetical protein